MKPLKKTSESWGWGRRILLSLGVLIVLVVLVGLVASPIATWAFNRKLASLPDQNGQVDRVQVNLLRGKIGLEGLELRDQTAEKGTEPMVRLESASLNVSYGALLKGRLRGKLEVDGAAITVTKRATEEANKKFDSEEFSQWQNRLREALPIEVDELEVKNSRFRFVDQTRNPTVDVMIDQLQIKGAGMLNRNPGGEALPTQMEVHGVTTGQGKLDVYAELDPVAKPLRFHVKLALRGMQLPPFNDFLKAYAGVDVSRGTFETFIEVTAKNGKYDGYLKPFLKDVDFKSLEDKNDSFLEKVKEGAADVVESILKNDDTEKAATQVPFSGSLDNPDVDVWTAIDLLLRNAFIEALRAGFGGSG